MNNVAGVIVLYNPDREAVLRNISSYIDHISELLVIDNSEFKDPILFEGINTLNKRISYWSNAVNEGIAKPLNGAATWAFKKGYDWLLTMDQDSCFDQDNIQKYILWLSTKSPEDMAIAGITFCNEKYTKRVADPDFDIANKVITSGSIVRLKYWNSLNGFDEKLFIDEVDHEFCYRAIEAGFKVCKLNHIFMTHEMGKLISTGYFGIIFKRSRMLHSPLRIYYMVRNYCAVRVKYKKLLPTEFERRDKEIIVILKNNLFFSGRLFDTLRMAMKGYVHYRKDIFGKYNEN